MVLDTSLTLAYKCQSCGTYVFSCLSFFELLCSPERRIYCQCGKAGLDIASSGNNSIKITMDCISCENKHIFTISKKAILKRESGIFRCPLERGMPGFFIGSDDDVRKRVDQLEKELDELIDSFGYESYFKNTRVMMDSLNRIHDIAEKGQLYCSCGSRDIELVLYPDMIKLLCTSCFLETDIKADSNKSLKEMLTRESIVLCDEKCEGSSDRN